ncbi:MAG: diacylglycerol kinase family lipid kinase [Geobacteraceae bacterium]|nr:diacylglycerol kinase family lipid kinase [Geobacteraceae bacterium]NTW81683.1 diacylglycerol kinase family lipid kinase [Geobacteraceae bacterium]
MKTFLFANPASGRHSSVRLQFVLERLRAGGIIPEIFQVRTPAEISSCCIGINRECGPHLVIVAGGDGTFNAVVNGLNPGTATLAVLPFGTSNVLAAEIGIASIEDGVARIVTGKTRSFSIGLLEHESSSHRFVLMAGIGLDGAVVRDVQPIAKKFLKQGAYALSALKRAIHWDTSLFEVRTPESAVTCHTAIICNASRYGGNFILSPGSSPFSSGLSAVCITGNTRRTYLNNALDLLRGRSEKSRGLIRIDSSTFEVKGNQPIQIDGDFVGYGPARLSELADFARIIV